MEPVTIEAKYSFTPGEKATMSQELAEKNVLKFDIDEQKKAATSVFRQQIDEINKDIRRLSIDLKCGFEMRPFRCNVEKDFNNKVKRYRDIITGDVVLEKPLAPEDYQIEM